MLVALVVAQLSVLLESALTLVVFAVKEVIVGSTDAAVTVTVVIEVVEPVEFVAVSV